MNRLLNYAAVLCLIAFSSVIVADVSERDASKLVKEYVSAKTSEQRRTAIESTLSEAKPLVLQKSVKKYVKQKKSAKLAWKLASDFKVPGLSIYAFKQLEDHEVLTINYLLTMQEKGAVEKLVEMWVKAETESSPCKEISKGFQQQWVKVEELLPFKKLIDDEGKRDDVLAIMKYQLMDDELTLPTLKLEWEKRCLVISNDGKIFEISGSELSPLLNNLDGATRVRHNYRVSSDKYIYANELPEKWQSNDFNIKVRLRADQSKRLRIQLTTTDSNENAVFLYTPGRWYIEFSSGESAEIKVDPKKWVDIELKVDNVGSDKNRNLRNCNLFIDGKELQIPGMHYTLNAELRKFTIDTTGSDSEIYIGGAEWWLNNDNK